MNDGMTAVLDTLPQRLRQAARQLWDDARETTDEVTETLRVSYKLLRQACGDPELLAGAGRLLSDRVAAEIGEARGKIDANYPAATRSWQGAGAETFRQYLPRLSVSLKSVHDSVGHTAAAVNLFQDGVTSLYTTIVDRTAYTDAEVTAAKLAARQSPHEAIGAVIDLVEEYSTYVEELTGTLLDLGSSDHAAGRRLAQAAGLPTGLVSTAGSPRPPSVPVDAADFRPVHHHIALDTAAMARLTASLSDDGGHWDRAGVSAAQAADRLTPEAFGLAGARFFDDVHEILDRDRGLYVTLNGHLDELAGGLRRAASAYVTTDDAIATELRRGREET